ncbi:MAG: ferritin [Candidatus Methanofastidiosa archaeon]|nr:ferritin [Candidatus Methanofastidiosa archaeon]
MIKENIEEALNKQVNWEFYSAYLYLSMSAYFESVGLPGFASWMRVQAQEEQVHAMKFYDYIVARGGRVNLIAIEEPPSSWPSPEDVFEETYKHEQKVTGLINALVTLAIKEEDYATRNMLQWFIDEQVEEEESAYKALEKLKLVGNEGSGLYMLDKEFALRVFNPPLSKKG